MKKVLTSVISVLLVVSMMVDSAMAMSVGSWDVRVSALSYPFNEEALSPRDIQTGTYAPVLLQSQIREKTAVLDEEFGFNRRALLRGAAGVVAGTGLGVLAAVAQAQPKEVPPTEGLVLTKNRKFQDSQHRKVDNWAMGDYHSGDIADVVRIFARFRKQEYAQEAAMVKHLDDPDFRDQQIQRLAAAQQAIWSDLRRIARNPELKQALAPEYSPDRFDDFVLFFLPRYAASFGIYVFPDQPVIVDRAKRIFRAYFAPTFFVIENIERPDFGHDLLEDLDRLDAHVSHRLILGGVLDENLNMTESEKDWFAKRSYQTIAIRRSKLDEDVDVVIKAVNLLRTESHLGAGQLSDLRSSMTLESQLAEVSRGANAWEVGLSRILLEFYVWMDDQMAREEHQGRDPRTFVEERLKRLYDRHEGSHELDEFDPEKKLESAVTFSIDDRISSFLDQNQNQLLHAEINASIGEIRYDDPIMALGRWTELSADALNSDRRGSSGRILSKDERQWVMNTAVDLLAAGWATRFGMTLDRTSAVTPGDQILVQLVRLTNPRYTSIRQEFADAVKAVHVQQYSHRFEAGKPVTSGEAQVIQPEGTGPSAMEYIAGAGVVAAAVLAAERILLRRPFARELAPVPAEAADIDRLFKASVERPSLSGQGWSFVRTGLRTGELTRSPKKGPPATTPVQSDALVPLSRGLMGMRNYRIFNGLYWVTWWSSMLWGLHLLHGVLATKEWHAFTISALAFSVLVVALSLYLYPTLTRPRQALMTAGVYRFTRNPIYLAQRLVDLTFVAFAIEHGLWNLVLAFALVVLINRRLVAWEETRMTLLNGQPYQDYLARVPRWLSLSSFRRNSVVLAGLLALSAVVGRTQPALDLDSLNQHLQQAVADRPYDASTIRREVDEVKTDWKAARLTREQVVGLQPLLEQPFETPMGTPFSQYVQLPGLPAAAQQQALKRQLVTIFHLPNFPKSLFFDMGVHFWGSGDSSKPPVEDETPGLLQSGNFKVTYHWWAGGQRIEYVGDLKTGSLQSMPVGQLFPTPPRGMHEIAAGRVLIDSNKPFSELAPQDMTVTITHLFTDQRHFDEVRRLLLDMAWALHLNAHAMKLSPSAQPKAEERFPGILSIGPLGLAINPLVTVVPRTIFLALGVSHVMNVDTRVGGFFNETQGHAITPDRYSYFLQWLSALDEGLGRRLTASAQDRGLAAFNDLVNTAEHILLSAHFLTDREAIHELTGHESTHAEIHKANAEDRAVLVAAYRAMKEDPDYSGFLTKTLGRAYDLQQDNFFDEHWTWYLWPNMGGGAREDNEFVQTVERQIRAASQRHPEMADTWKRLPVILQGLRDRASERAYDITDQILDKLNHLPKRAGLLFLPHGGHDLWVPAPGNWLLLQAG